MVTGLNEITLQAIRAEAIKAEVKHGWVNTLLNPEMSIAFKLAALVEEVGEVAQLFTYDKLPKGKNEWELWRDKLVRELLQVANLAAAWSECTDTLPNSFSVIPGPE